MADGAPANVLLLTARLEDWLRHNFPRDVIMPMTPNKEPKFPHKSGAWNWQRWTEYHENNNKNNNNKNVNIGILLRDLCVVDFDDEQTAIDYERQFPELTDAPCERTRKGRHYFFVRPGVADAHGFYDGARQTEQSRLDKVDFKSVCATGTSGTIVVAPSQGKEWIRPPWECRKPSELPTELLERIAAPRSTPPTLSTPSSNPSSTSMRRGDLRWDLKEDEMGPEMGPEKAEKIAEARKLADMLSSARAREYTTWIQVGWCLHNIDAAARLLLDAWVDFSRKCPEKFVEGECEAAWDKMSHRGEGGLGIGSLHMWAREDSPYEYKELLLLTDKLKRDDLESSDSLGPMIEALADRCPELSAISRIVRDKAGLHFQAPGLTGTITLPSGSTWGRGVYVTRVATGRREYLGLLYRNVPFRGSVVELHEAIPAAAKEFVLNQQEEDRAVLTSVTPNVDATITVHRPLDDDSCIQVSVPGKKDKTIVAKARVQPFKSRLAGALVAEDMQRRITLFAQLVNNGTININLDAGADAERHTDEELVSSLIQAHPELLTRVKFSPRARTDNCSGLYYCDPASNVWSQRHNMFFESRLVELFASLANDGALTDKDRRHVESRRGRYDMLYGLASRTLDEAFIERLDACPDIFAVRNGCFDFASSPQGEFRPLLLQDAVSTPAGWEYSAEASAEHRPDLLRFLETLFPVQEERRLVLGYFASLLTGHRYAKKFLVLTDRRCGNNGKSSLLALMELFYGGDVAYSCRSTKFVCRGGDRAAGDRNSHDAGTEPLRGKRLLIAEELKKHMMLDDALLKQLTGGSGILVSGRRFHSNERYSFLWQAGIVLVFNEGDCPQFDPADTAFMERIMVAPMRSKFVGRDEFRRLLLLQEGDGGEGMMEPWTFEVMYDVNKKFPLWLSALADVLREHRLDPDEFARLPQSMREWRNSISTDSNPLTEWFEQNVVVTGKRDDYLLVQDVKKQLAVCSDRSVASCPRKLVTQYAKAYFTTQPSVVYRESDKVRLDNGDRVQKNGGVVRGVRMRENQKLELVE